MSTSASVEDPHQDSELWTLRGLIADHRVAALGVAAVCAVMVAMIMVAVLGAKAGAVTDQTTGRCCTDWKRLELRKRSRVFRCFDLSGIIARHGR